MQGYRRSNNNKVLVYYSKQAISVYLFERNVHAQILLEDKEIITSVKKLAKIQIEVIKLFEQRLESKIKEKYKKIILSLETDRR